MKFNLFAKPTITAALAAALLAITGPAYSEEAGPGYVMMDTESDFDSAVQDAENAIINKGLVIDYKGMVGAMLARTQNDVGAKTPYKDAVYMQFCSASLTHEVVAADPRNAAVCPYVVFVYEKADEAGVKIGYRKPIGAEGETSVAAIAKIDAMLKEIIVEASEGL